MTVSSDLNVFDTMSSALAFLVDMTFNGHLSMEEYVSLRSLLAKAEALKSALDLSDVNLLLEEDEAGHLKARRLVLEFNSGAITEFRSVERGYQPNLRCKCKRCHNLFFGDLA